MKRRRKRRRKQKKKKKSNNDNNNKNKRNNNRIRETNAQAIHIRFIKRLLCVIFLTISIFANVLIISLPFYTRRIAQIQEFS